MTMTKFVVWHRANRRRIAESGAPKTATVWRAFRGIYGINLGVEQPNCGDQTARAVVHCSICDIT
jgi:hypothetical protein